MAQKFQESSSNACEIESWLSYYTNALRALHAMRFHCSFNFLHSSSSILKVPNSYICTATRTSLLHTCLADTLGGALSAHPRCVPQWSTAEPAQASRGVHTEVLEAKDTASRSPAALPINRPCCSAVPGIVQWQASWAQHSVPQLCCCPPRASKDAGPFRSCTPFIRNTAHRPMWVAQKMGGRDSRNDGSHKETDKHVVRDRNHEHCTTEKEGQGDEETSHQKSATGVVQTSQGAALPYSLICSAI